ncbi:MAG: polysaccharide pyruvyl transferase family protein [Hyphomicrobiaceae bacterium]
MGTDTGRPAIKFAQLYCKSGNVGDDVQAIAAAQHLPQEPDCFVDRDNIHHWRSDTPVVLVMNGWFSAAPQAWPPAPSIKPIFVGFHVAERFKAAVRAHADYLRLHEPIGVRDAATASFLNSLGISTIKTHCLTLSYPTRPSAPRNGKVFIVDAENVYVPSNLRKGALKLTHMMPPMDYRVTVPLAKQLIETYRDEAKLVITTRLHAALPCMAMGIPVVFFSNPSDPRVSIVKDVGGRVHDLRVHRKLLARGLVGRLLDDVDWEPSPIDVSTIKSSLSGAISDQLRLRC